MVRIVAQRPHGGGCVGDPSASSDLHDDVRNGVGDLPVFRLGRRRRRQRLRDLRLSGLGVLPDQRDRNAEVEADGQEDLQQQHFFGEGRVHPRERTVSERRGRDGDRQHEEHARCGPGQTHAVRDKEQGGGNEVCEWVLRLHEDSPADDNQRQHRPEPG